ncbi:BMC domain-containing protein [Clostridium sp.]|uniref:BMC domain-containing protein n=2 Tax=Clostridium sp. TaxID=1506 RepID=UPI003216340C
MMSSSIGVIEFKSISRGIAVADEMVKKAEVEILQFRNICPGRFLVILAGDEGAIKTTLDHGIISGQGHVLDSCIINSAHGNIIQALKNRFVSKVNGAIGIMETNTVSSGLKALDRTLKGANLNLVKLQVASGISGKIVYIISGGISDVEYGMSIAKEIVEDKRIVDISIIPSPDEIIIKYLN